MPGAFNGIKIIDFTQVLAGPFGVMQLALLGADVIKIEQPQTGDQTRGLMNSGKEAGMSPSFMGMNLNKKSMTLNLKSASAVEIIKQMIADADVIVEFLRGRATHLAKKLRKMVWTDTTLWTMDQQH